MLPKTILLSRESSHEARAVLTASMVKDIKVLRTDTAELAQYADLLTQREILPVGNMPFMQEAMRLCGIQEPDPLTYHPSIRPFLGRPLHRWVAGELRRTPIPRPTFIKPLRTKLFTGFVLVPDQAAEQYEPGEQESLAGYLQIPDDELVWTSPTVQFVSEWRYYVQQGTIIGAGRYDPSGADDAPPPAAEVVQTATEAAWNALQHPFALDLGVLQPGQKTVVVELNDAWAIGLYGAGAQAPTAEKYIEFLYDRWTGLMASGAR